MTEIDSKTTLPQITLRQLFTIIAALRHYQKGLDRGSIPGCVLEIATDAQTIPALPSLDIDKLCEQLNRPLSHAGSMPDPAAIEIFAVHDTSVHDGAPSIAGYSLDPLPGSADADRRHIPINKAAPGASLHLFCFASPAQALAFEEGLKLFRPYVCGAVQRTYGANLTAVLVEFYDSAAAHLVINTDHLDTQTGIRPLTPCRFDQEYRDAARRLYHREGSVEIDDNAAVSYGDDPGAYVQAWTWVSEDQLGSP
jgi:hypothetical protein